MARRGRSLGEWIAEQRRVYFENATATRDFRTQLRGNRPIFIFGGYLSILMLVAGITYYSVAQNTDASDPARIQELLAAFYHTVISTIAALFFVITPALTATSVVSERIRRSLDLVFCAPVEPKYFLVGKLTASYRYLWMLLFLSLPVTATCVVFGGATFVDVLANYVQLSLFGLMLTALSLCVSVVSPKPASALLWSYMGSGGLVALLALFGEVGQAMPLMRALSPLRMLKEAVPAVPVFGVLVPAIFITAGFAGLVTKLFVHAAGNLLAPHDPKAARSLRLHAEAYSWTSIGLLAYLLTSESNRNTPAPDYFAFVLAIATAWALVPLGFIMPILSTYSLDDDRVHRPNGWFNLRRTLTGTPAGALPFILLFVLGAFGAAAVGGSLGAPGMNLIWMVPVIFFSIGFWSLLWACGRAVSALRHSIREARSFQLLTFFCLVAIPPGLLSIAIAVLGFGGNAGASNALWDLYILRPIMILNGGSTTAPFETLFSAPSIGWTAFVWIAAIAVFQWSENRMRRMQRYQLPHSLGGYEDDELNKRLALPHAKTDDEPVHLKI